MMNNAPYGWKMTPRNMRHLGFLSLISVLSLIISYNSSSVLSNLRKQAYQYKVTRSYEHEFQREQPIMDPRNESCKFLNGEMHECWIGKEMLSKDGEFFDTLKEKASTDNIIILSSVDSGYVDMAINFYETSFKRFNITNFLFICSDSLAVKMLAAKAIDCFLYPQDTNNDRPSDYGHAEFFVKQRVKRKMTAAALLLGFTTVLSDVDMIFLKDPTSRFIINADVSFMMNQHGTVCAGFYVANPTPASIKLHLDILDIVMTHIGAEQGAVNQVLLNMTKHKTLKHKGLNKWEFATGQRYFQHTKHNFLSDKPCLKGQCGVFVVHNNFILTKAAKIYRFKENGMWSVDKNGYYSNPHRQYLQFSNPFDFGEKTMEKEKSALKTGLTVAKLLNRTLILPKFHCCRKNKFITWSSFIQHFNIETFDRYFEGQYREHVFLQHPLVPDSIKQSISNEINIVQSNMGATIQTPNNAITFNITNHYEGNISAEDVMKWFGMGNLSKVSVLMFQSLYVNVIDQDKAFQDTLKKAVIEIGHNKHGTKLVQTHDHT